MRIGHTLREDLFNPHIDSEYDLFDEALDPTNELLDPENIFLYDKEEEKFRVSAFSASVRQSFREARNAPILWSNVVQIAIDAGIRNVDVLANIPFYLNHQDRLHGTDMVGSPISKSEHKEKNP